MTQSKTEGQQPTATGCPFAGFDPLALEMLADPFPTLLRAQAELSPEAMEETLRFMGPVRAANLFVPSVTSMPVAWEVTA